MDFVVLCSSRGTTFQAILDRTADGTLAARCLGLISDSVERGCVAKAKSSGIPVHIVRRRENEPREEYDKRIHHAIIGLTGNKQTSNIFLACIGWLSVLSPWFVNQWKNRILNVHPSLLPKHPGLHAHEEVLKAGETESGMTIHLVTQEVDRGPILLQKTCPVLPGDTPETLKARVQELEKEWYPQVLQMIADVTLRIPPTTPFIH